MDIPLAVYGVYGTVNSVDLRKLRRTIPLEFYTNHIKDFAAFLVIFLRIIKGCTKTIPKRNGTRNRASWICFEVLLAIYIGTTSTNATRLILFVIYSTIFLLALLKI
jgi:hypothetical protein